MIMRHGQELIKVLIADDDERILHYYHEAFVEDETTASMQVLDELGAELFDPKVDIVERPKFTVTACTQGEEAISLASEAAGSGEPFDVVILDVRMPPGIDGVEAGSRIRAIDPDVEIIFVSGYSDIPLEELQRRVPPPMKLHFFNKPLSFSRLARDVVTMMAPH
jgi:CheY-like chemotaxis protein